ncbi:MAG TPA: histidine phosphatase family protein [Usitatibacter sp.]
MKVLRSILAVMLAALAFPASAQALSDSQLVEALRGGGYVMVFRHGASNADQADTDPLNVEQPGNEAKQRHLNDKGRSTARAWNDAFRKMGIPVGRIYTSKLFRAQETARLAFGEPTTTFDVTEGNQIVSPNENNRRAAMLRKMASTVPDAGTNTIVVTHKPNVIDAFGKDWFEVKEGEASVFKPDGHGGFAAVGRVLPDRWSELAASYAK